MRILIASLNISRKGSVVHAGPILPLLAARGQAG
jgi:hypothetical protein